MNIQLSSAVLFTDRKQFLIVKPTNEKYWEIPKGLIDIDEASEDTAIREFKEETNITLNKENLKQIGKYKLHDTKDIILFLYVVDTLPSISKLKCNSMTNAYGLPLPEIESFKYISLTNYKKVRGGLHQPILDVIIMMKEFIEGK